jgi:hypothetical protein
MPLERAAMATGEPNAIFYCPTVTRTSKRCSGLREALGVLDARNDPEVCSASMLRWSMQTQSLRARFPQTLRLKIRPVLTRERTHKRNQIPLPRPIFKRLSRQCRRTLPPPTIQIKPPMGGRLRRVIRRLAREGPLLVLGR